MKRGSTGRVTWDLCTWGGRVVVECTGIRKIYIGEREKMLRRYMALVKVDVLLLC